MAVLVVADAPSSEDVCWPSSSDEVHALVLQVERLRAAVALAMEASYWDRPYDTRIDAIRNALDV